MKPEVVASALDEVLRDDAIISSDSGTIATWVARHVNIRRGQRFSLSGNLATMANGLPYTIGAQVAFPDRQCVGFVGDGGFSMLMAEFSTAVKYRLPIKVVIIKNNVLGQIKLGADGVPRQPRVRHLPAADRLRASSPRPAAGAACTSKIRAAAASSCAEALAMDGPVLIEAVVDPNEPPMPPEVSAQAGLQMAEALARGEPNRKRIGVTLFRDVVHEADFAAAPAGIIGQVKDARLGSASTATMTTKRSRKAGAERSDRAPMKIDRLADQRLPHPDRPAGSGRHHQPGTPRPWSLVSALADGGSRASASATPRPRPHRWCTRSLAPSVKGCPVEDVRRVCGRPWSPPCATSAGRASRRPRSRRSTSRSGTSRRA